MCQPRRRGSISHVAQSDPRRPKRHRSRSAATSGGASLPALICMEGFAQRQEGRRGAAAQRGEGGGGYRRRLEGRGAGVHWNSGGLALTDLYYHHQTRSLHLSPPVRASLLHQRRINAARHVPFRGYMTVQRQELTGSCHAHTGVSEPKWDHEAPPGSFRQPPPPPPP